MTTVTDRISDLTVESFHTALDGASYVQRQNSAFIQSWLTALEANGATGRELVSKSIRQAQEAQQLWFQLWQESFRNSTETFSGFLGSQFREVGEQINTAGRQATNGAKKAEAK
jgi:hypothetical protein